MEGRRGAGWGGRGGGVFVPHTYIWTLLHFSADPITSSARLVLKAINSCRALPITCSFLYIAGPVDHASSATVTRLPVLPEAKAGAGTLPVCPPTIQAREHLTPKDTILSGMATRRLLPMQASKQVPKATGPFSEVLRPYGDDGNKSVLWDRRKGRFYFTSV